MSLAVDNRLVVLLKSLRTNNRFYSLVDPESGFKNADAIEDFPPELPLGIAYPCLEDGLNDFAVIRTTFETIDVFPDDDELRTEMMEIIADARGNLVRRLQELRDRIATGQAHFLGTNYQEFKDYLLHIATRGHIRRTLDNMMKVDVFESVAKVEAAGKGSSEPMYRYEFLPAHSLSQIESLPPRLFIGRLFDDVLDSVTDDANYQGKYVFDKHVFQKFIAVMFVNYATTDPMFYGTSREDYGVSSDKDMQATPLYQAVAKGLRELEREGRAPGEDPGVPRISAPQPAETTGAAEDQDLSFLFRDTPPDFLEPLQGTRTIEVPHHVEQTLLEPLVRLAEAVRLLRTMDHPHADELRAIVGQAGKQLFAQLQELQLLSPLASDPIDAALQDD